MFEPRNAFAKLPDDRGSSFVAIWQHAGFRPWTSIENEGEEPTDEVDAAAWAAPSVPHQDCEADAAGCNDDAAPTPSPAALAHALDRLADAAGRLLPCSEEALAAMLAEIVSRLLAEMFAIDCSASDHLQRRALQLARLLRNETEPVCLRLHPEDAGQLIDAALPWPIIEDSAVERGEIRLETREGGVSDSPAVRIERLRQKIAGEAAA